MGRPFLKCAVCIWALPVRGGVRACPDGLCNIIKKQMKNCARKEKTYQKGASLDAM